MKIRKRKTSASYGQIYFRVEKDQQAVVETEIQEVLKLFKHNLKSDELLPKRNELVLEALRIGLKALAKKYR
jgi:hypothetical protein